MLTGYIIIFFSCFLNHISVSSFIISGGFIYAAYWLTENNLVTIDYENMRKYFRKALNTNENESIAHRCFSLVRKNVPIVCCFLIGITIVSK